VRDRKVADIVHHTAYTKIADIPPGLEKTDTLYVKLSGNLQNTNYLASHLYKKEESTPTKPPFPPKTHPFVVFSTSTNLKALGTH
jgi:hypothetical protein